MSVIRKLRCISSSIVIIAILGISVAEARIYKWVDEEGNTHYGERPAAQSAERMKLELREPVKAAPEAESDAAAATGDGTEQAGEVQQEQDKQAEQKKPEPPKMSKREKRARCKQAKQNLATIQSKGRIREADGKGSSRFLSPKEIKARKRAAKKSIRQYCR